MLDWIRVSLNRIYDGILTLFKLPFINFRSGDGRNNAEVPNTSTNRKPEQPKTYHDIDWENSPPQYKKRKSILSYREREFYRLLMEIFGQEYQILSMVRMADVLWLSNETDNRKFFNNQILCKHLDYVICDKLEFKPIIAIELDDSMHYWESRWRRDQFKNKACAIAGLPLERIKIKRRHDRTTIETRIRKAIGKNNVSE